MNSGWIKTYRKLSEWEWYKDSAMVHLFIHLIITANYKESTWKSMVIERGQLVTSRKILSEQTGISEQSIRTCLMRLQSTSEITIKSTNRNSIITICNYDKYQDEYNEINQQNNQPEPSRSTSNQPTIIKEVKEVKETKNIIYNADVEEIYKAYPAKCPIRGANSGKSSKDKEKIKSLLKNGYLKEKLLMAIKRYTDDCVKNRVYMKNFKTFLNNIPDYEEEYVPPEQTLPFNDGGFRDFRIIDKPQKV